MTSIPITNHEQAEFWGGPRGRSWVANSDRYDAQLERYGLLAVGAAAPLPGDKVLDVGCGTGAVTFECAAAVGPGGLVVGVDISEPMLARADERRAELGLDNVRFLHADVQALEPLERPVDAIVSRFGVMFFEDPVSAFRRLAATTRDRGRLGFVCWAPVDANEWMVIPALALEPIAPFPPPTPPDAPGPFSFGDRDRVEGILAASGWDEVSWERVDDPLYLGGPGTLEDAVRFVLDGSSVGLMVQDNREEAEALLARALAPRHDGTGVKFHAQAYVVRAAKAD